MINAVLLGYAQVFFSTRVLVGAFFMIATFTVPAQGLIGLASLCLSNLFAYLLGFCKDDIRSGYFGYNGLLTGLALGLVYRLDASLIGLVAIASCLGVLIAASLQSLFRTYLSVPVLSLPFVITTWLALAGARLLNGLTYTLEPFEATFMSGALPPVIGSFLRYMGSTFFQVNLLAGLLIALGVLLFSRHAFFLAIVGLLSGSVVWAVLKGNVADPSRGLIEFNFILTAIAVGGVFTTPGIQALALAVAGSAICALLAAASTFLLTPLGLPVLAFPFIATTCIMVFALRQRATVRRFSIIPIPESSPEKNLKHYRNHLARFLDRGTPAFFLPVSGEWTVTQGFDGQHTHKGLWSHAWDFEIADDEGERGAAGPSTGPDRFYAFDMPVYAAAEGKVVTVISHIEDNRVGQVNSDHNWGNVVIVWHYGGIYTAYCHLRQGTVTVSEGEAVKQGQVIGRVGNSGRSVVPHLHFQVQNRPEAGAPTIASQLLHFTQSRGNSSFYFTHGNPGMGERIKPITIEASALDAAGFPLGGRWNYEVSRNGRSWRETWDTEMDLLGNRFLVCKGMSARVRYVVNRYALLLIDYEGPRETGLYWLSLGLSRLPMTAERVTWEDTLPGEMMLSGPARLLFDLAEPLAPLATLKTTSRFLDTGPCFSVETILNHGGLLASRKSERVRVVSAFERQRGLVRLSAYVGGEERILLRQIEGHSSEHTDPDINSIVKTAQGGSA